MKQKSSVGAGDAAGIQIEMNPKARSGAKLRGTFKVECVRDGALIWCEEMQNLVTDLGCNEILEAALKKNALAGSWYVGLTNSSPSPAAGDTMASHGGWTEFTSYSEANRQTWTGGTVASKSVDNSASKATFNVNGSGTVGGCFLTSNNTKGGTTGTLFSAVAFSAGNRSVLSGDILRVTYTFTAADDGV